MNTEKTETKKKTRAPKPPKEEQHSTTAVVGAGTSTEAKTGKNKKEPRASTANKIAGDEFCKKNIKHHLLVDAFPENTKIWFVDKLYPYTKYGEILVDEPQLHYNIEFCKKKAEIFKKAGINYIVLKGGTSPLICTNDQIAMDHFGMAIE